ncbi:MAG: SGNH/GDSL hydrolase family protein [Candidatus Izemoplasmatales bacterium]
MKKKVILFQGDSITDCDRLTHDGIGNGYVSIIASKLPDYEIINRGISGNKTNDLLARWQKETIDLQPDILSIMVGVNDLWHQHAFGSGNSVQKAIENYKQLLEWTKKELPNTLILMMDPYLIVTDDFQASWKEELDELAEEVKKLAFEYSDLFIPTNALFEQAALEYGKEKILYDGIHPNDFGHQLLSGWVLDKLSLFL